MKKRLGVAISSPAVVGALLVPTGAAVAAENPTYDDLTAEQKQAIAAWEAPQSVAKSEPAAAARASGGLSAMASYSGRTSLYRGSWLMWANEHVDFRSTDSAVTWSSGFQEAGAVFPNNVTRHGTSRISTESWRHMWRGGYTVGAGVPTPWGNANVYNATSYANTSLFSANSWMASWTG